MLTVLFDIDGTLISCGGAGLKAIAIAMDDCFGIKELAPCEVRGRTDRDIFQRLFATHELNLDQDFETLIEAYWNRLPETLRELPGKVLPGVESLLEILDRHPEVAVGLLTGNGRRAAKIKLEHFGIDHYFSFGGFGDDHGCRNDVARQAVADASRAVGTGFDRTKVWVVGDTIHDIRCSRAIGARVLAVGTGGVCNLELQEANPDAFCQTLEAGTEVLFS